MVEAPKTSSDGSLQAGASLCLLLQKKQLILYARTRTGKRRHSMASLALSVAENNNPPTLTQFLPVREAIRMNTIKVVNFDWLEDSLRSKKCLKERKYLMEVLHAKKRRQPKGELSCNSKVTKSGK